MSVIRSLHLRKQVNAICRHTAIRSLSIETKEISQDHTRFLQAADQTSNRESQKHLDSLIAKIQDIDAYVNSLSPAVAVPIRTRVRHKSHALEEDESTVTVPYVNGLFRQNIADTTTRAKPAIDHAQHLHAHHTDLLCEPYSKDGDNNAGGMAGFKAEIAKMSQEEQQDRLQNIKWEEEAAAAKLKTDTSRLAETAKQLESVGKKPAEMQAETPQPPQKNANPWTIGGIAQRAVQTVVGESAEGKTKASEAAAPKKIRSLVDIQKDLIESLRAKK
ncbi:hypothetical protein LTR56_016165 [Elasticomyces elasticus]|nr:hypothetical protein LTR56_016165 [Elasticomyces elasticus]KAK3642124.1 hypothetical protein LTR22_016245 [Elasticomyces elasticus]KAK4914172.1 hypothetical protein LTR49_017525 [Elasticomyces elasticus]KAK5762533.1 hypothetical protein LTS12_007324 [Elasticomyces elasticus]